MAINRLKALPSPVLQRPLRPQWFLIYHGSPGLIKSMLMSHRQLPFVPFCFQFVYCGIWLDHARSRSLLAFRDFIVMQHSLSSTRDAYYRLLDTGVHASGSYVSFGVAGASAYRLAGLDRLSDAIG
jgi:hypothetical protein